MSAVCPVSRLAHDWSNGLACRWCDATRTPGEAILSGLASRRGGTEDSARTLLDAYRAEVLAEAAARRGHAMTDARSHIHAMLPILDSPAEADAREKELDARLDALTAEVRRTDAAHLLDQRHHHIERAIFCDGIKHAARLLEEWASGNAEKATATAATATPEFFQPGRTYAHGVYRFSCEYLATHPTSGHRSAWGWFGKNGGWRHHSFSERQFQAREWIDVTEGGDSRA